MIGFPALSEVSIIALIDGKDCSSEESVLGYYGLILWIAFLAFLMVGQFVLCEEHFVPILSQLGDRLKITEDVQGATLLAIGSSSPELFTALLGIIFYPNNNPGPGTNVGSAVFNMCIIIGLSAISAPKIAQLQIIPFLRDSISYVIGLIELYIFYAVTTPNYMDVWESVLLILWWCMYVVIVFKTDILAKYCCCCISKSKVAQTIKELQLSSMPVTKAKQKLQNIKENEYIPLEEAEDDAVDRMSFLNVKSVTKCEDGKLGVLYDERGHCVTDLNQVKATDNIHVVSGAASDVENALDDLNRKQRQNVNKGWMIVIAADSDTIDDDITTTSIQLKTHKRKNSKTHAYVRRRTLMETLNHQIAITEAEKRHNEDYVEEKEDEHRDRHSFGAILLHKFLFPWTKLFGCMLPKPEAQFASKHMYITIMYIVFWLGLLTFFVVDCAEKIGECLSIPSSLLGITLLAIGSSLPDCISSVIVAKQMKLDMAIANAFGSNIFDVNLCVGFSFMLGSITNSIAGEPTSIFLGDEEAVSTFCELIVVAAVIMVLLWFIMFATKLRLMKFIGYVLIVLYVGYIIMFSVLFIRDMEHGDDFGEG